MTTVDVSNCPACGHTHTATGCVGEPTASDRWAGVSPSICDCDSDERAAELRPEETP